MELAKSNGQMGVAIQEITLMEGRRAEGSSLGLTGLIMMVILRTTSRVMECMSGLMTGGLKENGRKTRCMDMEFSIGQMAVFSLVSTSTTKSMVMDYSNGLTRGALKAFGEMGNRMELQNTQAQTRKSSLVSGKMELGWVGSIPKKWKDYVQMGF